VLTSLLESSPVDLGPCTSTSISAAVSDRGLRRSHNEDRFGAYPELGLFVVADGMGGHAGGEIAAQIAVDEVHAALSRPGVASPSRLEDAIERANWTICRASSRDPELREMGTTIAALLVEDGHVTVAHVGDSRVYRLRNRRLEQLTEDHSLFNYYVRAGLADPANSADFPYHNVVTRALGLRPVVTVDTARLRFAPGDTFMLCSDGLSGVVDDEEITAILLTCVDLDHAARELVTLANERGGPDNITVVLVRQEEAHFEPSPVTQRVQRIA
jgi:PPM family protein phosphatase